MKRVTAELINDAVTQARLNAEPEFKRLEAAVAALKQQHDGDAQIIRQLDAEVARLREEDNRLTQLFNTSLERGICDEDQIDELRAQVAQLRAELQHAAHRLESAGFHLANSNPVESQLMNSASVRARAALAATERSAKP